jgi:type III restriction enzyme
VAAFAKNAGPQKLMIDYLKPDGQRGLYAPDFFARAADGTHYLIELKGRQDNLVPLKACAAVEWCRAARAARAGGRGRCSPVVDAGGPRPAAG